MWFLEDMHLIRREYKLVQLQIRIISYRKDSSVVSEGLWCPGLAVNLTQCTRLGF